MAHLVDSSAWVAFFLDNDADHARAVEVFSSLKGDILVPYCVVNEVTTVLAYKHSKEQADAFLDFLHASSNVTLIDNRIEEEIDFYQSQTTRASFTDCALVYLAHQLKSDLVTFDRQQKALLRKYRSKK